ncbi:MAG TPA: hypothetical protein VN939_13880 [Chthoniobacterales bacterium]|nr:hypothetical protein [Chthoniobacterales bacterium]
MRSILAGLLLCGGLWSLNRPGYCEVIIHQIPDEVLHAARTQGTLRTAFESVGVVVQTKNIVYQLDFSDNQPLEFVAQKLDGKRVIVERKFSGEAVTYGPISFPETKSAYYFKVKTLTAPG